MKFEISNLGYIKQAEIELGDLTIICGKNNTGKTYVNYAIYGFLKSWKSNLDFEIDKEINQLIEMGFIKLEISKYKDRFLKAVANFSQQYSKQIFSIFSTSEDLFSDSLVVATLNNFSINYLDYECSDFSFKDNHEAPLIFNKLRKSEILNINLAGRKINNFLDFKQIKYDIALFLCYTFASDFFSSPFIITSERTGVALFYKELDLHKNIFFDKLIKQKEKEQPIDFDQILNESISRYSKPINDEINFVRDLDKISKIRGELAKNNPEIMALLIDIIGGDYSVTDYSMSFKFTEDNKQQEIPLYSASSTVKSLMNLYFYLKHLAKPGDILIIDEPELNLHPENQRKLAKLFSRLTKCGLKLLMTTHSDYLIEELNNLIVFNNEFENKSELMEKYKYSEQDILDPDKVRVYIAENNTLNPAKITPLGIEVPTFDAEINNMNDVYNKVTDNLDIAYDS